MEVREIYDRWLRDFADDPDTVAELRAIADDDKEIDERFIPSCLSALPVCAA